MRLREHRLIGGCNAPNLFGKCYAGQPADLAARRLPPKSSRAKPGSDVSLVQSAAKTPSLISQPQRTDRYAWFSIDWGGGPASVMRLAARLGELESVPNREDEDKDRT